MDWASAHTQLDTVALVCEHAPGLLKLRHVKEAINSKRFDIAELMLGQDSIAKKVRRHRNRAEKNPIFAVAAKGSLKIATMITKICATMNYDAAFEGHTVLHIACRNGHVDLVRFFLDQGADLNIHSLNLVPRHALALAIWPQPLDEFGFPQGPKASRFGISRYTKIEEGFIDVVKEILSRNPDLDRPVQYLEDAVRVGRADIFDLLVEHGIGFGDQVGLDLSLHDAIYSGSPALVERLLELGASVKALPPPESTDEELTDDDDEESLDNGDNHSLLIETALQAVAIGKTFNEAGASVAIADLLLKHGAAIEHPHIHRRTLELETVQYERSPLRLALEVNDIPLVEYLLQANAHLIPHQICPMYFVRSVEAVQVLENYGFDINKPGIDGSFPLIMVTRASADHFTEDFRVFEYLVNKVADVNATDSLGRTALSHCCKARYSRPSYLSCLLNGNANPNVADAEGRTALHEAVMYEHGDLATLLVEHGADVNAGDNDGYTPVHEAMKWLESDQDFYCYFTIAELLLLKFKADPDARSLNGTYAMYVPVNDWAQQEHIGYLLWLYSRCKSSSEIHPYKPRLEHYNRRIRLENLWTDDHVAALLNRRDGAGKLALVHTAGWQEPLVLGHGIRYRSVLSEAKLLLQLGADFNKADASGTTPLQAAISAGNDELRDHLLSLGASTTTVGEND